MSVSSIPGSQAESQEWIELPLLELIEPLESGSRPKGGVRGIDSGIPSVGGEHLTAGGGFNFTKVKFVPKSFYASMRRGHIRRGDILIVKDGATTGKVALVRDDFPFKEAVVNEHVFIIRPKSDHDCRYIFWYLHSKEGQERVLEHFQGAAQGGINQQFAPGTLVPIPPTRDDEAKISAQIEGLVEGLQSPLDRLATIPALLKKFRQSVLAAACSGQLTADWRRPDDVPQWKLVALSDVSSSVLGKMLDKGKNRGTPKPYLRNINVRWWGFELSDLQMMPFEEKESQRYGLKRGDVLICEGGEPGRCAVWDQDNSDIRFQKAIHRVRCSNDLNPYFLAIVIRHLAWSGELVNYFTGSGIAHLTGKSLATVEFDLPPIAEQLEIVRRVESLFALADSIESRLAEATAQVERTTQAILAKAFRGEL